MDKKDFFDRFNMLLENVKTEYGLDSVHDAMIVWFGENCLLLDPDDVKERTVKDKHAEGVDAVLMDQRTHTLFFVQAQTTESLEKTKNNFSENHLKSTLTGAQFLIKGDYKGKITPELENLVDEYHDLVETGSYKTMILFLIMKEKPLDEKFITEFKKEVSKTEVDFFDFNRLQHFYENVYLMRTAAPPDQMSFSVITNLLKKESPHKSIVFTCRANELAKIYNDYRERIFQQNVRYSLGLRSKSINRQILETAINKDRKKDFWYFNNGITIICKEIDEISTGKVVNLKKAQVINGAQTTYALYEAYKDGKLDENVQVLVKAIETDDRLFIENVTLFTNSQNAIRLRDLCSNDEIQIQIQKIIGDCYRYFYERKRGEFESTYRTDKAKIDSMGKDYKSRIISNENAAQAFLAFYLDKPSQAKAEKGRIFLKDASGFYDAVFSNTDALLAEKILLAWKLLKFVEKKKKEYKSEYKAAEKLPEKKRSVIYRNDFLLHSEYFLTNILKDFFVNKKLDVDTNKKHILEVIEQIDKNGALVNKLYETITGELAEYSDELKKTRSYYHNKFYKSEKSIGLVRNYLREKYKFVKMVS
jgi:hypothetical protein